MTFYYINLKPPPTAMSIKNKQKNTSFIIIFFTFIQTQVLCTAVWGVDDWILTWFDDETYTKPYMHKETIDSS